MWPARGQTEIDAVPPESKCVCHTEVTFTGTGVQASNTAIGMGPSQSAASLEMCTEHLLGGKGLREVKATSAVPWRTGSVGLGAWDGEQQGRPGCGQW